MHIKDLMSHPVVTCTAQDCLDIPARLMWEYDCGIVPVVDHEGRLAGVITDRDISMAAYTQGRTLNAIGVTTAMASKPIAAHPEDPIESVEHLMRDNQIRRVPIIDSERRPIGLVSLNDLLRQAARAKKSAVDRELVQVLAAVCQPRGAAAMRPQPVADARAIVA
jgi:CBS domain-containing protein